jgi:hypothetical protein
MALFFCSLCRGEGRDQGCALVCWSTPCVCAGRKQGDPHTGRNPTQFARTLCTESFPVTCSVYIMYVRNPFTAFVSGHHGRCAPRVSMRNHRGACCPIHRVPEREENETIQHVAAENGVSGSHEPIHGGHFFLAFIFLRTLRFRCFFCCIASSVIIGRCSSETA